MNRALRRVIANLHVDPIGVAMPGVCLPQRIRSIIEERGYARISRMQIVLLVASCVALCTTFLAGTLTRAQSSETLPTFDVASVRPTSPDDNVLGLFYTYPGGRIEARGCTLTYLIMVAYSVQKFQISGGDGWIDHDRFSISAEPPADSASNEDQSFQSKTASSPRRSLDAPRTARGSIPIGPDANDAR